MNSNDETLRANGYEPGDGEIIGSRRDYFYANPGDYAAGKTPTFMRDAVVNFGVLEFSVEALSPFASKFIAELVKVLAPADRRLKKYTRPLVRITGTGVQAVYQAVSTPALFEPDTVYRPLFEYGLKFSDSADPYVSAHFSAHSGSVQLSGAWLSDRSPLNTKRDELPECPDDMARQLRALVDRFIAAGEMRERGPYVPPSSPRPQFTYGEIDISVDPEFWDQGDPRRFIEGNAERVRKLRREFLGREPPPGEVIRR